MYCTKRKSRARKVSPFPTCTGRRLSLTPLLLIVQSVSLSLSISLELRVFTYGKPPFFQRATYLYILYWYDTVYQMCWFYGMCRHTHQRRVLCLYLHGAVYRIYTHNRRKPKRYFTISTMYFISNWLGARCQPVYLPSRVRDTHLNFKSWHFYWVLFDH